MEFSFCFLLGSGNSRQLRPGMFLRKPAAGRASRAGTTDVDMELCNRAVEENRHREGNDYSWLTRFHMTSKECRQLLALTMPVSTPRISQQNGVFLFARGRNA